MFGIALQIGAALLELRIVQWGQGECLKIGTRAAGTASAIGRVLNVELHDLRHEPGHVDGGRVVPAIELRFPASTRDRATRAHHALDLEALGSRDDAIDVRCRGLRISGEPQIEGDLAHEAGAAPALVTTTRTVSSCA
jgi:hypothetical protein